MGGDPGAFSAELAIGHITAEERESKRGTPPGRAAKEDAAPPQRRHTTNPGAWAATCACQARPAKSAWQAAPPFRNGASLRQPQMPA